MKIPNDFMIVELVSFDFGGFLIKMKIIMVDQKIINIIQPTRKA